ncbi:MAG: polysaccharide deacetylase family protein [Pseudomonadota bacterium]
MITRTLFSLLCMVALSATPALAERKRIAITFDDAPRGDSAMMGADLRTDILIKALARAEVEGALFFSNTGQLQKQGEDGAARLARYVEAGHYVANHSHSHGSAHRMAPDVFLADVAVAHQQLSGLEGYVPLFRFPFLHEGNTRVKRDTIRAGLRDLGLLQGYVTVDNYDWYLQALFSEAIRDELPLNLDAWRALYVEVLMSAIRHYDALAVDTLGRSPAHVLLLHENDLAALFIDDLVAALRAEEWDIVPGIEAYKDPISGVEPDTLVLGQGRVAALAAVRGRPSRALRQVFEDEALLRALAVEHGLVNLAEGAYLREPPPGLTPRKFAPGVISLPDRFEYATSFSADGRELFFGVAEENHRGEIHSARFVEGTWSPSAPILADPVDAYADPYLSRDGTQLFFISGTPAEDGGLPQGFDLWYVQRTRSGWSEKVNLGPTINSDSNDYYVSFTDDGTLAFASGRDATARGDYNLYLSKPGADGYGPPEPLPGKANTRAYEADPFIAPDGSYILFSSSRRSGMGKRDLYATFLLEDGTWSRAISLGPRINTPALEFCPSVTRDGRFLFYTSDEDLYWVDAGIIELARAQLSTQ